MALTLDYNFNGVVIPDAYISVFRYQGNKEWMKTDFGVYLTQEPGSTQIHSFGETVPLDLEGGNPVAQAYEWLKTQPGFESAVDC
jgi:hypothetical protein